MKTETQPVLPPLVIDKLVQTDFFSQTNESCQTDKPKTIDFQVQVNIQPEIKIMSTQTITPSMPVKIENQEIAMPNRPCSSGSKKAKKRKLSSIQTPSEEDQLSSEENQTKPEEFNEYEWGGHRWGGRNHKIFYASLKILDAGGESIEIKTGDHITIENGENSKQPFVAKVNKFYEDTKKETDKKRVLVEW